MTDNNDHITTEELIHAYESDRLKDNATDGIAASELLRLQQHAERDIYKDIRNEILRDITEDEKKKELKEIKRAVGKERFIQLTTLLLESGLLAFLIGILVNQVTSLLTTYICPNGYSGWIIAILAFLIVVVFVGLILRNISQFFNIGEGNESK